VASLYDERSDDAFRPGIKRRPFSRINIVDVISAKADPMRVPIGPARSSSHVRPRSLNLNQRKTKIGKRRSRSEVDAALSKGVCHVAKGRELSPLEMLEELDYVASLQGKQCGKRSRAAVCTKQSIGRYHICRRT
jgi:hypothetical protein